MLLPMTDDAKPHWGLRPSRSSGRYRLASVTGPATGYVVDGRLYSVTEVRLARPEGEDVQFPLVQAGILLNAFGFTPGVPPSLTPDATGEETTTPSGRADHG